VNRGSINKESFWLWC